jgi:hypothetical protein
VARKKKTSTTQLFSINENSFLISKSSINGVTIFTRQPNLWKKKQKTGKNPKITLQNTYKTPKPCNIIKGKHLSAETNFMPNS